MARATIEMGTWAISALKERTSLAALLARDSDPRSDVETGIALGMYSSTDELNDRCGRALDEGYKRIKIKIEPGRDIESAQTALAAARGVIPVSVDANASYSAQETARLRELDALGLAMIEQPLTARQLSECATLQSLLRTPICLDESITDLRTTEDMISLKSARIVNIKPGRVGGFTEALAIHDACARAGIPVWCGGMLETGIGRAYNVALASLPNFTLPGDLSPSARYWTRDIIAEPWLMREGSVRVPLERAGIGVDIDIDFVESITTKAETFSLRRT
jgi:O-succinylbenzoate synthase